LAKYGEKSGSQAPTVETYHQQRSRRWSLSGNVYGFLFLDRTKGSLLLHGLFACCCDCDCCCLETDMSDGAESEGGSGGDDYGRTDVAHDS
jgi:hypothetical protein